MNTMKEPLRILHCLASLDRGGAETFIMNVYRGIDRSLVQFDFLYSYDGVYKDEIKQLGGHLYQIPFITQCGPFAYRKHVMQVLHEHPEYHIIHSHMDKFSGLIMECAKKQNIPVRIAHSHSTRNEGGTLFQLVKNYYGNKIATNCTDRFACSEKAATWLFGNQASSTVIVKNGVDLSRYSGQDHRNPNNFTICAIGRFVPVKNHAFLIDVFAKTYQLDPTSRLILAGSGVLMDTIKEKVNSLGLTDYVTFLGDCNNIPQLLEQVDVLCMPSLFEGLPIVTVEAQSAGVPCVVSDTITREINITDSVAFLSLADDPTIWAKELLHQKGKQKPDNRDKVAKHGYDISATIQQLQLFYLSHEN